MCKILDCLHEYVPLVPEVTEVLLDNSETVSHVDYKLGKNLLGGDQFTVARAHSAKKLRVNNENTKSCLKEIILVIEDWHTRLTLMKVNNTQQVVMIIVFVL